VRAIHLGYPDNGPDNTKERMKLAEGEPHEHPVDPERVAAAQAGQLSIEQARQLGLLLSVIGDPIRARILTALLAADELCVGDLALALEVNEDAVSYGLRVLRRHGLVQRRAAGRMGFYRLTDGRTRSALVGALQHLDELARNRPPA
jgi:ArsR family transcriptional regulator, lead/cadmium/zinc/bismuth-responsive transcriptional repressor